MSIINLEVDKIRGLSNEISTIDSSLLKRYFPQIETQLEEIQNNVLGESLNGVINNIISQFNTINTSLTTSLPKLETFLDNQIKAYTLTEEELKEEVNTVLNKIANLLGVDFNAEKTTGEKVKDIIYNSFGRVPDPKNISDVSFKTYAKQVLQSSAVSATLGLFTGGVPAAVISAAMMAGGINHTVNTGETWLETLTN